MTHVSNRQAGEIYINVSITLEQKAKGNKGKERKGNKMNIGLHHIFFQATECTINANLEIKESVNM